MADSSEESVSRICAVHFVVSRAARAEVSVCATIVVSRLIVAARSEAVSEENNIIACPTEGSVGSLIPVDDVVAFEPVQLVFAFATEQVVEPACTEDLLSVAVSDPLESVNDPDIEFVVVVVLSVSVLLLIVELSILISVRLSQELDLCAAVRVLVPVFVLNDRERD